MYKYGNGETLRIDPFETLKFTVLIRDNRGSIELSIPKMDSPTEAQLGLLFDSIRDSVEEVKARKPERKTAE